ncbi:MAG: helix-turn-helix transcriptional regulator [Flavobacterium sp.]|uniref:helix-turn-helix transcriptional regulator n=1 Tax=Flavobacterium sp. TaxID=239 RepID=UPI00326556C7
MIKQKLIDIRKEKGLTQADFAFKIGLDASNYNRRENGITKISKKEWNKIAKELNVKLEEVYEPNDGIYIINNDNAPNDFNQYTFETMKKYIVTLEEENSKLKQENTKLKEIN